MKNQRNLKKTKTKKKETNEIDIEEEESSEDNYKKSINKIQKIKE